MNVPINRIAQVERRLKKSGVVFETGAPRSIPIQSVEVYATSQGCELVHGERVFAFSENGRTTLYRHVQPSGHDVIFGEGKAKIEQLVTLPPSLAVAFMPEALGWGMPEGEYVGPAETINVLNKLVDEISTSVREIRSIVKGGRN